MFSDPKAPAETFTWRAHDRTCQPRTSSRSLRGGQTDTVAFLLPNSSETVLTYLGGALRGRGPTPDQSRCWNPARSPGILRETKPKVLVTLGPFPKTDIAQKAAKACREAPK